VVWWCPADNVVELTFSAELEQAQIRTLMRHTLPHSRKIRSKTSETLKPDYYHANIIYEASPNTIANMDDCPSTVRKLFCAQVRCALAYSGLPV